MHTQKESLTWLRPLFLMIGIMIVTFVGFFTSHYVVFAYGGTVRYTFLYDYFDQSYLGLAMLIWLLLGQLGALITFLVKKHYSPAIKQMVVGVAALLVLIVLAQWVYMLSSDAYAFSRHDGSDGVRERFAFAMGWWTVLAPTCLIVSLIKPSQFPKT